MKKSLSSASLMLLALSLAACSSPSSPSAAPSVRAQALPAGMPVVLRLSGPSEWSREELADAAGSVTFTPEALKSGAYDVTAEAFDQESAPRVALYSAGVSGHIFGASPLDLSMHRISSDVRVTVATVPPAVKFLKASVGGRFVGLPIEGGAASGVLQGIATGKSRTVLVEGTATPGGPVTYVGSATLTVQPDNAANVAAVVLKPATSSMPATPLLQGAPEAQRGAPYTLTVSVPDAGVALSALEIDWGDGQTEVKQVSGTSFQGAVSHTFEAAVDGGFDIQVTAVTPDGGRAPSQPLHVLVQAGKATIKVHADEDDMTVRLAVNGVPAGTERVEVLMSALAGQAVKKPGAQSLKSQYAVALVPGADGVWRAALGLPRGRAYATQVQTTPGGAPTSGAPFTVNADGQDVSITLGGQATTIQAATFTLVDAVTGRPRSGTIDQSLKLKLSVKADADGPVNCEIDTNGDGTFETPVGDCRTAQAVSAEYSTTSFLRSVPRARVTAGSQTIQRAAVVTVGRNPKKWVSGYYALYESNFQTPDQVGYQGLSHLFVGAVMPWSTPRDGNEWNNDPGNWVYQGILDDRYASPTLMTEAVQRAHAAGIKAIMMVGGSGGYQYWGFTHALERQRVKQSAAKLIEIMDRHGFDGIDLDFEAPGGLPMDMEGLRLLADELRARRPDMILTFAGNFMNKNTPDLDVWVPNNAQLFDQINMMSYDMAGPYDGWLTWHSGALYDDDGVAGTPTSINTTVRGYLGEIGTYKDAGLGIPANKVGIGIGFYGSCQRRNYGPREVPSGIWPGNGDGEMSYWRIVTMYGEHPELGKHLSDLRRWDDKAKVPYLTSAPLGTGRHLNHGYGQEAPYNLQDCDYVSYEDPQSIAEKAQYVRDRGLGGTIIWSVSQTFIPEPFAAPGGDRNPLLTATRNEFLLK